jgi:oligosaccharide repeat unit polymerase
MLERSKLVVQKKSKNWLVLLTQVYVVLGLTIAGIVYAIDPTRFIFSIDTSFVVLSNIYLGLTIWSFGSWYLVTSRLFDPYILFLLAANIFNGGQIVLEIFGLNENGFLNNTFSVADALQVVYIVTLAIATMHLGALMAVVINRQKTAAEKFREFLGRTGDLTGGSRWGEDGEPSSVSALYFASPAPSNLFIKSSIVPLSTILTVGRVFLFISVIPVLITAVGAIQVAKAGGYASIYEQQAVTGVAASASIVADFIFPGVFLTIAGGSRAPKLRIFAVLFLLLYTCAKLTVGTRGAAVMPLLAMLWLWNEVVKPIPKSLLFGVGALLLLVVFPVIGATRNEVAGVDIFSIDFLTKTLTGVNNPLVASISEMGFSATTIGWTMDLVPKVRPFALGSTFLVAVLTLIPNIFTSGRHPALTMSGYDIPDFWLVAELDEDFADRGGSFGFSFIAEAYLNFGWFGIFFMGLLGFGYAKLVQWALRDRDPVKMSIIAVFVAFFLFYPRGSLNLVLRPFIWYAILPYIGLKWMSKIDSGRAKDLLQALRKSDR